MLGLWKLWRQRKKCLRGFTVTTFLEICWVVVVKAIVKVKMKL